MEKHAGYIYYFWYTLGYNSLGDPTMQHEVGKRKFKNNSTKTKAIYLHSFD